MIDPGQELKAYLDGELTSTEAEQVQEALLNDPALAAQADQLRAIAATLARESSVQPVGLEQTLAAIRNRKPWWRQPAIAWPAAISVAGAIGMAVFLTVVLMPAGYGSSTSVAKFVPRQEADSSAAEMDAKADTPTPLNSDNASDATSSVTRERAKAPEVQTTTKAATKFSLNAPKAILQEPQSTPSSMLTIDLKDSTEAYRLLDDLAQNPNIVSIKNSPKTATNELSATVTYKGAPEAVKTLVGQTRLAAKHARVATADPFQLRITLKPAKR